MLHISINIINMSKLIYIYKKMTLREIKIELAAFSSYVSRDGSVTTLRMYSSDFVHHCSG